jgi:tetratricopeptide (TPR) repeat protein
VTNYDCNSILFLEPYNAGAYMNRGLAFVELNQLEAALSDHNRSIFIDCDNPDFYNNRAWLFIKLDNYHKALEDFKKAALLYVENDNVQGYQKMIKQIQLINQ